jgi:hypothetical protein
MKRVLGSRMFALRKVAAVETAAKVLTCSVMLALVPMFAGAAEIKAPASAKTGESAVAEKPAAADANTASPYRVALSKAPTIPLLLLDPTERVWALQVTSGSKLSVLQGHAMVDSSHDKALWVADGTIDVPNGDIGVVGGVHFMGQPTVSPEPTSGLKVVDDPFPAIAIPEDLPVVSGAKLFLQKPDVTLTPGVYRGGIFSGGAWRVVLRPGVYIMEDGDFFASGAQLEGEGVTLVFSGARPGAFWTAANTQLSLSAPTEGPLQGLLIVSRAEGNDNIRINSTQGTLNGVIYAPATGMALSAGSEISVPRVVCANLSLTLSSTLEVTGADVPKEG